MLTFFAVPNKDVSNPADGLCRVLKELLDHRFGFAGKLQRQPCADFPRQWYRAKREHASCHELHLGGMSFGGRHANVTHCRYTHSLHAATVAAMGKKARQEI